MLARHDWPGNVRELRNVVERLLLMPELGAAALLGPTADGRADTEAEVDGVIDRPYHEARALWAERFERAYLEARLEAAGGVVLRAAESAGIPRQTFHRLMRKHGLRTGTTPTPPPQSAPDQDLG
jgi:two-component system response regulator AtoC